jgi:UDP-N-acetyl-alpha-D-muramoyl-L-alanyl-L-glutamate epimerase
MKSPKYQSFIFEDYEFRPDQKLLHLHYSLDDALHFTEQYRFNFAFADYDEAALERAVQNLFFMAGVSYYKTYLPPEIVIRKGQLDQAGADFFSKTYQRGLGEFWYVNQLDPHTPVTFPTTASSLQPTEVANLQGLLIGVGGGKDSLLTIESLRTQVPDLSTWSLGHQSQLEPLVERIGLPHVWAERSWDRQLLELNQQDALNGHIPISAIIGCAGAVVAILSGRRDIVVSNEQAANEPTLTYQGVAINHQYSKSQEFERDFQAYLGHLFGDSLRYYSFLRPLSELRIAELFAASAFAKYQDVFSSCNRAFTHASDHLFWCGECPKCAFIFMVLTPFVERVALESLWNGKNLLLDPGLEPTYRQLLGIEGDKPLDCVGEIKESRAAMRMCQAQYPELKDKYDFELPDDYDYRALGSDEMPTDIKPYFTQTLS